MRAPLPAGLRGSILLLALNSCTDQGGAGPGVADGSTDLNLDVPDGAPDAEYAGPALLSQTGLYTDLAAGTLAPGVIAYQVRYELWADGAEKSRFLLLPDGETIDNSNADEWRFPVGTKAWKEFRVGPDRIETRFMEKLGPDRLDWLRVAFVWREDGTDADAAPDGVPDALGTAHDVPSSTQCYFCHNGAPDNLIGVSAYQIGAPDGDGTLAALEAMGRLTTAPAASYVVPGTGVVQGALAYLHSNCGHCHNNNHFLADIRLLRLWLPVGLTVPEDAPVYSTAIGLVTFHNVMGTTVALVPGDPDASQIHARMSLRDGEQMPPIGTEVVDAAAVATVRAWIEDL